MPSKAWFQSPSDLRVQNKKSVSTCSYPGSLAPHPPPYLCFPYTRLFLFLSHLSFRSCLTRSPLCATCLLLDVSSIWAGRKSLEQTKPFISRGDLICVPQRLHFSMKLCLSACCSVKLSLLWSKLNFYTNLLPDWVMWLSYSSSSCATSPLIVLWIKPHTVTSAALLLTKNRHFWHLGSAALLDESDECEALSTPLVRFNQVAS